MSSKVQLPVGDKVLVLHRFGRNAGSHALFNQSAVPIGSVLNSALVPYKGNYPDKSALYGGAYSLMGNLLFCNGGSGYVSAMSSVLCDAYGSLMHALNVDTTVARVGAPESVWQKDSRITEQVQTYDAYTCARKFGSRANPKTKAKARLCWSVNHNETGQPLEPVAPFVYNKPMCRACYMFNACRDGSSCNAKQQLQRPMLSVADIRRRMTTETHERFDEFASTLKRMHLVACLDSSFRIPHGDPKALELHGASIVTEWYEHVHVHKERAVALAVFLHWPLFALSVYWVCSGGKQRRQGAPFRATLQVLGSDSIRSSLRNHGMAIMSAPDDDVPSGRLMPAVAHTEVQATGLMPWHLFVCVKGTWVLADCVRVLAALHTGRLTIDVDLVPPVPLRRVNGTLAQASVPGLVVRKGRAKTVFKAETITWGFLAHLLALNDVAREGQPLAVQLVGSLTFAVLDDGKDGSGGVFQALCELALSTTAVPALTVQYSSKHGALVQYANDPTIQRVLCMVRQEKAFLRQPPTDDTTLRSTLAALAHDNGFGGTALPRASPTLTLHAIISQLGSVSVHAKLAYRIGTHSSVRTLFKQCREDGHITTKDASRP